MATTLERTPNEIWAATDEDRWPIGRALLLAMGLSAIMWAPILYWLL